MALTLNATLATAQDSQSRRPLIEIISKNSVNDIPFDGQLLTAQTLNEQKPNAIAHSSGRLCQIFSYGPNPPGTELWFKYVYTDAGRTTFNFVTISRPVSDIIFVEASLCELQNGNIGIIYYATQGTAHVLRFIILSVTGAVVVADTQIASYTSLYPIATPFVIKLADNSYLLIYTKKDGANYRIMKRTSSDFQTWSAESECSIGGLSGAIKKYDTSLIQISTNEIFLWFTYVDSTGPNGEELTNVYYSVSSDNGATWGAAVKVTSYTGYGSVAEHPMAVQKTANQMHLIFNEKNGALIIDKNTAGYCSTGWLSATDIAFDAVDRKLYVKSSNTGAGYKILYSVGKIDVDTWTIVDCWSDTSVPAFNAAFFNTHTWYQNCHGDRNLFPVHTQAQDIPEVSVVDGTADTIANYIFKDYAPYGKVKNVSGVTFGTYEEIKFNWLDFGSKRLYVLSYDLASVRIGYFDLTQTSSPYPYNQVAYFTVTAGEGPGLTYHGDFAVIPALNYLITSLGFDTGHHVDLYTGRLLIHLISDGSQYKDYKYSGNPAFPYHGLRDCLYLNGKIYGTFNYESAHGQADYRGLCEIDLATDAITYHRPTYATLDEYDLGRMAATNDGRIIMTCPHGVAIYTIADGSWNQITHDSLPGLMPVPLYQEFDCLAYDETAQLIYAGIPTPDGSTDGAVVAFSIDGYLRQSHYKIGAYSGGVWSWGASNNLVQGITDYDLAPALDPDHYIYAFWTNKRATELSIKWDKENTEFDLSPYLLRGEDIEVRRSIDGSPSSLSFRASHGHLFDPHNINSLLSIYLAKFRKLNLRFGEKVSGIDYWQQAGIFFVTENSLNYERPQYPAISIKAEDILGQWEFANILATEYYETTPKTVLEDIITTWTPLLLADTDFPIFENTVNLYHQWVETSIKEILTQVCNRFGYFPRIKVDGKVSARKISNQNAVDHTYADNTKIIRFTPDDSFSDYTNQVIVIGESRDWIEVLYPEEAIATYNGTMGWWGKMKKIHCWYSPDHSRRARYARLEIVESVKDGPFYMSNGDEYIGWIDPYEKGLTLYVEGPNLVAALVAWVAAWLALSAVCSTAKTFPQQIICNLAIIFTMFEIMQILGTQGMFQYNVYAQPVGKVRQSLQAKADDTDLQALIGTVISKKLEDPLCYTIDQCQLVANFEIMIAQLQRKRVKISKLAHLQDEEGDTIKINHPYSAQEMKIFITDLTRRFKIPSSSGNNDGYFLDDIEGWNLT